MSWPLFHLRKRATLYVHFPCFDGIVSGVLAILFLERSRGWKFRTIRAVNYGRQKEWINERLRKHAAVVDFLYHPQAEFWADHHPTTFLNEQMKQDFERWRSPSRIYDRESGSCASLLWRTTSDFLGPDPRLEEMVRWAEKIDSASYASVEEALSAGHPALVLSKSLAIDGNEEYCRFLITRLEKKTLEETAQADEVQKRFLKAQELNAMGLNRVRETIRLEHTVAIFEANGEGVLMNRYSPYYFYPQARYSIGIIHYGYSTKITAMRNPWFNFANANLGEFMRQFGGGGHQRVGSLILENASESEVRTVVSRLLNELASNQKHVKV